MDGTLAGQIGPGSYGNEVTLYFPELGPHYQMLFSVISRTPFGAEDAVSIF